MAGVHGWVLGLDTATPWRSLALWHAGDGRVRRDAARLDRATGGRLLEDLASFLAQHGVAREALTGIGVGVGPGSYTGIRIGIAAALGLGRALEVPIAGSGTLEAVAFGVLRPGEAGWALLDARRERVHALQAARDGDRLQVLDGPRMLPRAALPQDGLPRFENQPPDALWHALSAPSLGPVQARYG